MADGVGRASKMVGGGVTEVRPNESEKELLTRLLDEGKLLRVEGNYSEMPYSVTVMPPESNKLDVTQLRSEVVQVLRLTDHTFSHFLGNSEVSRLNQLEEDQHLPVSSSMEELLGAVDKVFDLTHGAFDPSLLPIAELGKHGGYTAESLQRARENSGWCTAWKFIPADPVQREPAKMRKLKDGAKLDLCGMAKGWCIDQIASRLSAMGIENAFIDWGGDIKVLGRHPVGRAWTAQVRSSQEGKAFALVELHHGQAMATSGDSFSKTKTKFSHVVDGKSKDLIELHTPDNPEIRRTNVATVVSESCAMADAFATAALSMGDLDTSKKFLVEVCSVKLQRDRAVDYLLYCESGPRLIRKPRPSVESAHAREERLTNHVPGKVIVVGGGLAGLSAAIEAAVVGAAVTVLEKEPKTGGNSAKATSGINGWGTNTQAAHGIHDDERYFERDTFRSGLGGTTHPGLIKLLSAQSREAVEWLMTSIGVPLTVLSQLGGASKKRAHRAPPQADGTPTPIGFVIMKLMREYINREHKDSITILNDCTVTKLVTADGSEVQGVEYTQKGETKQLLADATILATGGFGYGKAPGSLLQEIRPDLKDTPTTNGPWTDGSGIRLGRDIGALLTDMEHVQLHPTGFVDPKDPGASTKYLGPEALRGSGGILVNHEGKRFVNELDLRSKVTEAILKNCKGEPQPFAYCILNQKMQDSFGRPLLKFYHEKMGLFQRCEDIKELASHMKVPEANLMDTFNKYEASCKEGFCRDTEKTVLPCTLSAQDKGFLVAMVTPAIHYCMGGLEISPAGEVQRPIKSAFGKRQPIKRLFAAGECTGGMHGANRLGGNSLLECVVVGRTCGERAGTICQKTETCLSLDKWQPVTYREERETGDKYGASTRCYRFNLHGALQNTGLCVGQYIAVRGVLDGDTLMGYFSPVTRPYDLGCIDILSRGDEKGGPIVKLLAQLRPGGGVHMRAVGGLTLKLNKETGEWSYLGKKVTKLNLLAGGTGIAPMIQIVRSFVKTVQGKDPKEVGIRLVYAAESSADLAFAESTERARLRYPDHLRKYVVLNTPPVGWTQGVGFADQETLREHLWPPHTDGVLSVMCGPPIFEKIMWGNLVRLGHKEEDIYSYLKESS